MKGPLDAKKIYQVKAMQRSYNYNMDDVVECDFLVETSASDEKLDEVIFQAVIQKLPPEVGKLVGVIEYYEVDEPLSV